MSGFLPKADIRERIEHVCFVPIPDIVAYCSTKQELLNQFGI